MQQLKALTGGYGADVVLEVTGVPAAFVEAVRFARPGGTVVEIGNVNVGKEHEVSLAPDLITRKMLRVQGFVRYQPWFLYRALRFLERKHGNHPFDELTDREYCLVRHELNTSTGALILLLGSGGTRRHREGTEMSKKNKKYVVRLTEEERAYLRTLIGRGSAPARTLSRARILLKANEGEGGAGWSDAAISEALEVGLSTVARVRQRYVSEGLEATLTRKAPEREYRRKLDGEQEARLIALACGEPPTGRKSWTLRMLAERLVALEVVESVSYETVRQVLKQTNSSLT